MTLPIIFDANFFLIQEDIAILFKQVEKLEKSKKFDFNTTSLIVNEIKGKKTYFNTSNAIQVHNIDSTSINSIKSKTTKDPQDPDMSLIVCAELLIKKLSSKTALIVSNDYKLHEFVKAMGQTINVVPVGVICFYFALYSEDSWFWRKFARKALQNYVSFNKNRANQYDIEEIVLWLINSMADLLNTSNILGNEPIQSEAFEGITTIVYPEITENDVKLVKNIINGEDINLVKYPYLSLIYNHFKKFNELLIGKELPDATLLKKEEIEVQRKSLIRIIDLWQSFYISCEQLNDFSKILLKPLIMEKIIHFQKRLMNIELRRSSSDSISGLIIAIKNNCIQINDFMSLFEMQMVSIINYIKVNDFTSANIIIKSALEILPEKYEDERFNLQVLLLVVQNYTYNNNANATVESISENEFETIQNRLTQMSDGDVESIFNLIDKFIQYGEYSLSTEMLMTMIQKTKRINGKKLQKIYQWCILSEKLNDSKELRIQKLLSKLADLVKSDNDVYAYFKAENPQTPSTPYYVGREINSESPLIKIFRGELKILRVSDDRDCVLLEVGNSIFECEILLSELTQNMVFRPSFHYLKFKPEANFVIEKSSSENRWIEGRIVHKRSDNYEIKVSSEKK
jgi:hypothetical protein